MPSAGSDGPGVTEIQRGHRYFDTKHGRHCRRSVRSHTTANQIHVTAQVRRVP